MWMYHKVLRCDVFIATVFRSDDGILVNDMVVVFFHKCSGEWKRARLSEFEPPHKH